MHSALFLLLPKELGFHSACCSGKNSERMDRRSDGKCVAGPVSIPPKKKFFKLAFPNGSAVENWP